jgi:phosphatidylinositol alpha-1,6-mannosyltransferase
MSARPHLLICLDFPPMMGGIARWMQEIALHYPPGGLIVSTGATPGSAESDALLPNRVDRLPVPVPRLRRIGSVVRWSRRVVDLARESGAEFAWCGNVRPAGYPAWWARRRLGLPYGMIFYGHDLLATQRRSRTQVHKPVQMRALLRGASVLVAISDFTTGLCADYLEELGIGEVRARLHTVPLGTDPARFRPGLPTDDVRARYQLPPGGRWLVTVARLTPHKGFDTALRALAALGPGFEDVRYLAIGSGPQAADLRELAGRLGVADRFHLLQGVPDGDLAALYNIGTLYVGLSRRMGLQVEGFGISLTEASASGLPVLGGKSGGVEDAVREGETGLLVDPESVDDAAAAIRRLLGDPGLAGRLGAGGRLAAETYFNWSRVTADLRRLAAAAIAPTPR